MEAEQLFTEKFIGTKHEFIKKYVIRRDLAQK